MKVKVYEASTMQEAIAKVKRDLGSEAVILFTKKYPVGGFLGLFRKERVEVTAGLELNTIGSGKRYSPKKANVNPAQNRKSSAQTPPPWADNSPMDNLQKEVKEIKDVLKELLTPSSEVFEPSGRNPLLKEIEQILVEREVDQKVLKQLIDSVALDLSGDGCLDLESARMLLAEKIKKEILTSGPICLTKGRAKTVALVGPTGVGKTTTLAKIAAQFALLEQKKVAFVTADTYRIAAVEQLCVFGEIVDIPVEVANGPSDLKRAVAKYMHKVDLILIDTAGRSPKNEIQLKELKKLLSAVEGIEIHLALSATTSKQDLLAIIEKFKPLDFHRLLFTKLDETCGLGSVLSVAMQVECPISYFTTGQNVPDDIEIAQADKLSTAILN